MIALAAETTTIVVAVIAGTATVTAAVIATLLPFILKMRRENHKDHAQVVTSVDLLAGQVAGLMQQIIEVNSELRAHIKWEENSKYASRDDIQSILDAVADRDQGV
jgi:hypothetical protein